MVKKRQKKSVNDTPEKPEYEPPSIPGDKKPDDLASDQDHPDPNPK
ncbi:MAG: hypothetical protein ABSA11_06655 [Candidatus Bathyarchaeia archaeon]|jgi:hypothetical protein